MLAVDEILLSKRRNDLGPLHVHRCASSLQAPSCHHQDLTLRTAVYWAQSPNAPRTNVLQCRGGQEQRSRKFRVSGIREWWQAKEVINKKNLYIPYKNKFSCSLFSGKKISVSHQVWKAHQFKHVRYIPNPANKNGFGTNNLVELHQDYDKTCDG
jgi:hypothetical protein